MTSKQQNNLWSVIGLVSVYLAIDFWLATQGGDVNLPSPVQIDAINHSAAIYGLIIVGLTFASFLYITHSLLKNKSKRLKRLPEPFGITFKLTEKLDRKTLILTTAIFMLLPMASIIHMENKMLKGRVNVSAEKQIKLAKNGIAFNPKMCINENKGAYGCILAENWSSHLFNIEPVYPLLSGDFENAFQYNSINCSGNSDGKCKGLTFFPFFQPWLFILLGLGLFIYWCYIVWLLIRKRGDKNHD